MTATLLAIAIAQTPATAPVYRVSVNGIETGRATLVQRLQTDGGKQIVISMTLGSGNRQVRVRQESVYSASGVPVRTLQETLASNRRDATVVRYADRIAKWNRTEGDKETTGEVPLGESLPWADESQFWILRTKPRLNASSAAYTFDIAQKRWLLSTSVYRGKVAVKVGPSTISAHHIETSRAGVKGALWLDDAGTPLVFEFGDLRIEQREN